MARTPWITIAVVVGVAGCAGVDAMPQVPSAAAATSANTGIGFYAGETMAYEVHLAGLLVGEAQLAVGEPAVGADGKRALAVKSRIAAAGTASLVTSIVDESTTLIDADNGRPLRVDTVVVNGDKRITVAATFSGTVAEVVFRRAAKGVEETPRTSKLDFKAAAAHDMHTAMGALRNWRPEDGSAKSVYIIGGRRLWRIDLAHRGTATIGTRSGNRRAIILEGTTYRARNNLAIESDKPARSFKVWLSDDGDRVPLRCEAQTEYGAVVMELVEYVGPQ
jgi:hypothetical protein